MTEDAKKLCSAVFAGDLPQIKRLLKSGLRVDAGDYDNRTVRIDAFDQDRASTVNLSPTHDRGIEDLQFPNTDILLLTSCCIEVIIYLHM